MSSEDCPSCRQFGPAGCCFSHPMKGQQQSGQKRSRNNSDHDSSDFNKKPRLEGVIPLTGKVVNTVRRWNAHGALYMHTASTAPPGCACDARTGSRCPDLQVLKTQHEQWWEVDRTPEAPGKEIKVKKMGLLKIANKWKSNRSDGKNVSKMSPNEASKTQREEDKENKFSPGFLEAFNQRRVKSKSRFVAPHDGSKKKASETEKDSPVSKEKVKSEIEDSHPIRETQNKCSNWESSIEDIAKHPTEVPPIPEGHLQKVVDKLAQHGIESAKSTFPDVKEEALDKSNQCGGESHTQADLIDESHAEDDRIREEDEKCEQGYYRHLGWFLSLKQLEKICSYKFGVPKDEIQFVEAKRFPFQMYKCGEEDPTWKELSGDGFRYTVIYERSPEMGTLNIILYWKRADEETKEFAHKSFRFLRKVVTWLEDPEGLEKRVSVSGMGKCDCNGPEYPKAGSASVTLGCTKNSIQRCRYRFTHKKLDPASRQARIEARKWKVKPELRDKLKAKMKELAERAERFLYAAAPKAWERMVEHNRKSSCHLFGKEEFPFTSTSLTVDFRAHCHQDTYNMPLGATTILNLSKRDSHLQPLLLPRRRLNLMLGQGDLVVKYSKAEPHATGRTRRDGACPDRFSPRRIGVVFYAHDLPHPAHGRDVKPKEKTNTG